MKEYVYNLIEINFKIKNNNSYSKLITERIVICSCIYD